MPLLRLDHKMHVVGHNAPSSEFEPLTREAKDRITDDLRDFLATHMAFPVARFKSLFDLLRVERFQLGAGISGGGILAFLFRFVDDLGKHLLLRSVFVDHRVR